MSRYFWILAFALCAGWSCAAAGATPSACVSPPLARDGAPLQSGVPRAMRPVRIGAFTLSPLAGLGLEARVLSRADYTSGTEAALSPTDLALGWSRMADPSVYRPLGVSQSGRWYRYQWGAGGPPIPVPEIVRSSANMHMIPADEHVARALARVRAGQTVRLQGWLVEARRGDWIWRSSLSRDDTGEGACEVVYVCALSAH